MNPDSSAPAKDRRTDAGTSQSTATPLSRAPRARLFWALRNVGWGVLLTFGVLILLRQIVTVSQGATDFCQDYLAAGRLAQGLPVYTPIHCWTGYVPAPAQYDAHPPFSVLFFFPFGVLPAVPAAVLWGVLSLVGYLVSALLLLRALGRHWLPGLALFVLGSIFWEPLNIAVGEQNFAELLTFLLVSAWLLEGKRRDGWAGWALGLAGLLKLWPALVLLGAALRGRWRLAALGGLVLVVGALLALVVVGPGAYAAYLGPVRANEVPWLPNGANVSLVGAVARLFTGYADPPLPVPPLLPWLSLEQAVLVGEAAAGLLLVGTLALITWAASAEPGELVNWLSQGVLVTVLLLVFPLTWYWELLPLVLAGATLLLVLRQVPRPSRWWFLLLGAGLLPLVVNRSWLVHLAAWLFHQQHAGAIGLGILVFSLPTLGLLLFAGAQGYLLWSLVARRRSRPAVYSQQ